MSQLSPLLLNVILLYVILLNVILVDVVAFILTEPFSRKWAPVITNSGTRYFFPQNTVKTGRQGTKDRLVKISKSEKSSRIKLAATRRPNVLEPSPSSSVRWIFIHESVSIISGVFASKKIPEERWMPPPGKSY